MCDPLSIASVALAAGGTVLQQQGRAQALKAQDSAAADSIRRTSAMRDEANALFRDSTEKLNRDQYDQSAAENEARRKVALVAPNILPQVAAHSGESDTTAAAGAREADKVRDALIARGEARARLAGGTDAFVDMNRAILPNAENVGFVRGNIAAENDLLPIRMASASRAGGGLREIGSIVSGLGTLGAHAAAGGASFDSLAGKLGDGWNWLTGAGAKAGGVIPGEQAFMIDKATL